MIELMLFDASSIDAPLANPELILSSQELRRYEMMRSEARRREFLLGRILLKAALTDTDHYRDRDFTTISPAISATGKPTLARVEFNLSHDGAVVFLALGDQPVGVDIETVQNFDAMMLDLCFTTNERRHIASARDPDRTATLLWCKKEAAAKATGGGFLSELGEAELRETRKPELYFSSGILSVAGQLRAYAVCSPQPIFEAVISPGLARFQKMFSISEQQKTATRGITQLYFQVEKSLADSLP